MGKRGARFILSGLTLAVCALALTGRVAGPQSATDLSGQWNSNIGAVYQIQQSGNQFTWSAPSLNQSGTGTVSGNNVTLSGPGWMVKGTITETDASGQPTKIVGENGVVLFRTTGGQVVSAKPPAQQPVIPAPKASAEGAIGISGKWNSNIGAVYEIQQGGSQFTWSVPSLNQSGTGTVSGNNVTMSGPGWTVNGTITKTDSSGNATNIIGENGIVLFRTLDGQPGSAPPPAQKPGPQASAPAAGPGNWPQFKDIPPLSPQVLTKVAAPMTRQAMIDALSASPTTKSALEKVAASAGTTVSTLKEQTLSGKPAVDAPVSPSSKPAQAFLDLWKAPVRFSPTVPGPSYQEGGSTRVVGMTQAIGVYVHRNNSLQMMAQKDYYLVVTDGVIIVDIDLPPGGGQYMVAIHMVNQDGVAQDPQSGRPVAAAYVRAETPGVLDEISLVKNSTNTALVGLFSESPANRGWYYGPAYDMPHVSVDLRIRMIEWGSACFTGITVTRL